MGIMVKQSPLTTSLSQYSVLERGPHMACCECVFVNVTLELHTSVVCVSQKRARFNQDNTDTHRLCVTTYVVYISQCLETHMIIYMYV